MENKDNVQAEQPTSEKRIASLAIDELIKAGVFTKKPEEAKVEEPKVASEVSDASVKVSEEKEEIVSEVTPVEETSNEKKDRKQPKEKRKSRKEREIEAVDLSKLTKPVNDAAKSGPKKMKDFSKWPWWKTFVVGLAGIVFVVFVWWLYSYVKVANGGRSWLSTPQAVFDKFILMVNNGALFEHLGASLSRILVGYLIAIVTSIPIGFLMAWYKPVRAFLDPFIQFLRCIPPIAYVPVVVAAFGVGEPAKYFIIWLAVFLTMTVTIYQGVKNVDFTLVKAAYTFGAKDRDLFIGVIVPNAFPFILTALRLGIGVAMTTLVASELTGTVVGLGAYINTQGNQLAMDGTIMGIIVLGICGIVLDKLLLFIEKRLTRWK